jgi:excisionase family DNA binding protein
MSGRKLYSTAEAAEQLSISERVLGRLIADGVLETVKIGRRRLVPDDCLDAYIQKLRATA